MRQTALGQMHYTPETFGRMLIGDFIDALSGYLIGEYDRKKSFAETIRISTTILWNKNLENPLSPEQLWPFPWENTTDQDESPAMSEEEEKSRLANLELHKELLKNM